MGLPVVGMVGGGPLSRLTHQAAISLGLSLRVLADDSGDSAVLAAGDVVVGSHTSLADLAALAEGCEVVTVEDAQVPAELLHALEENGHTVHPGSAVLRLVQDRPALLARLSDLGVPVAAAPVAGTALVALVARSPYGQAAAWPVVQTLQADGDWSEVVAPAPGLSDARALQAQELALDVANSLGVVGVLAVELSETADGVVVHGLTARPHHSGHWTIEGSHTSQFEQHLRAVLDYPLGTTGLTAPHVVTAHVLGGEGEPELDKRLHLLFGRDPALKVHLYGTTVRPGHPVGHVTALGDDLTETRDRARTGARYLRTGTWNPS
jgi:5-(carboxyamino)imidazole ribonucleotide synthase